MHLSLPGTDKGSRVFNLGGGVWGKGSIDRTINQLLWTLAPKAPKVFLSSNNEQVFFTKYMANDDFSEPS